MSKPDGSVTIASNPVRERETLDKNGNVIDPKTKAVIRPANKQD